MKERIEKVIGRSISPEEWFTALCRQENKLHRINDMEGTYHGEEYLEQLMLEKILMN